MKPNQIISLWMKYCYNYKMVTIKDHQGNEFRVPEIIKATKMEIHLGQKWYNALDSKNGTDALMWLWCQLDGTNQELMAEWLVQNYKG
jgi:hypothetical protein